MTTTSLLSAGTQPIGIENALADPFRFERRAPSCSIVIFGANGDLAKRKLIPALYRLACEQRIPSTIAIVGNSRTPMTDEAYRAAMRDATIKFLDDGPFNAEAWDSFARSLFYVSGDLQDSTLYKNLDDRLEKLQKSHRTLGNTLFYLSTQPSYYGPVIGQLGEAKMQHHHEGWRRVIVEKPFGRDLLTASDLNNDILKVFEEDQIFRIDHYLGKETVQNILAFRFGNGIFEPLWNQRYINHIQITSAESIGVEGRGAYYQEAGALRDMIQNHLIQVMATVGMEPPAVFTADAVRDERAKFLRSIRVLKPSEVSTHAVAGQYGAARLGTQQVPGFREESGVKSDAQTDTYAAMTLFVDNWRWAGV
ncbi:MAG TPA: glucose-6-phosphate dehydrogenase, partial [Candidatus Angelobacter sp.]|nr:glucose-6-phosphate dehydrogenase [Candidatus Angelobacter sp.]